MATRSPTFTPAAAPRASLLDGLQAWLPKLVLAPSMLVVLVCVYGYIGWTLLLSFTNSRFMPAYSWAGLSQYLRLWDNDRWWVASKNLLLFGGLFIGICLVLGVFLAVLLDQRIRREGFIRTVYLYPMALSMIVTGTAWKWLLNPGLGLDKLLRDWGWTGFRFDWLVDPERVVYCLVIAAVWQARVSSWRCSSPACAGSTRPLCAPPRWTVRACRPFTCASCCRACARCSSVR